MERRTLAGVSVPLLGFGAMRFPTYNGVIDMHQSQTMIDLCMAAGINYFDTAYPYHESKSEQALAKLLGQYPRTDFMIADKFPPWMLNEPADMDKIFNIQLKRLGTYYIDFYLIHSMERANLARLESMKVYEHFMNKKQNGDIKKLGFSFHDTPEVLEYITDKWDFDFAQIQMNYLDWSYMRSQEMYEILVKKNIDIIVMEPVRGGFLADPAPHITEFLKKADLNPPAVLALKWAAQFPGVKCILSGMSSPAQVKENIDFFTHYEPMTQHENVIIENAARMISDIKTYPCTGCRYCMDCPYGVDIPELFRIYNHYKAVKDNFRTGLTYKTYFDPAKKPENCTVCGICVEKCPQKINIPEALVDIKNTLNSLH